ncbi:hypothetical protein P152DRAFT_496322 [Eremomyces bilateralis CBS 781.70]|uniref:Rhodopsin domain-containing protein n=1 Tax=Eremomyces bilateralis CBS 781.70 TaxID=1392243 RepID=A0A6G1GCC8_9PEZI|nr:uncharacterized protein P152DRAFT_496322 [Eremomyces bilateralis CBS 781.70]KAF1815683.1 hypothetical protein P152DRAFT_496322 [Eremomyces bilateralis CBS 781.70]
MSDDFFNSFDPRATNREHETKAPIIVAVHTSLLVIALILYICRMVSRSRPTFNLHWDDYLITIAMVLVLISYSIMIYTITLGYGRRFELITDGTQYVKMIWVTQVLWQWGLTFIKLSVAAMLLRIQRATVWRIGMSACIVYLVVFAVVTMSLQLTECKPLEFYWNKSIIQGTCRSRHDVWKAILATSIAIIFSDVLFSLLPLTFIFLLNRPLRDKLVLAFLMGLGLLCAVAGIRKLFFISVVQPQQDMAWDAVEMGLWASAESYIGIMAACIPCLRAMFENGLKKMGISLTSPRATQRSTIGGTKPSGRFALTWDTTERYCTYLIHYKILLPSEQHIS